MESYSEKTDDFLNKLVGSVEVGAIKPSNKRKRFASKKVDYSDNFDDQDLVSDDDAFTQKKQSKKIKVAKIQQK